MVILDANILIHAVLGKRVREILETHSARVRFFAPDTAFAEAREHLPGILLKRGIDPEAAITVLAELAVLIGASMARSTRDSKYQRGNACRNVMKKIGRYWQQHWRSNVRFGRKTRTFSVPVWRRGRQIALNCCFGSSNRTPASRIPNKGAAGGSWPHRFSRRLERRAVVCS